MLHVERGETRGIFAGARFGDADACVAQEDDHKGTSMKADDLLEILKEDKDSKRDEAQSGVVSDKACSHLIGPLTPF